MLHVNRAQEPHVNQYSFTFNTEFLKQNDQNSTRKSLHVSGNIAYNEICHKCINIRGEKSKEEKK